MTAEEQLKDTFRETGFDIENKIQEKFVLSAMKEYALIKCKELLEIVAEKAKVGSDWEYKGGDSNIVGNYTKTLVYKVDKDSIVNAVDLDSFCS